MQIVIIKDAAGVVFRTFTADYRFDFEAWLQANEQELAGLSIEHHMGVKHLVTEPSGEITASNHLGVAKQACKALNELDKVCWAGASVEGYASARQLLIATIENTGHDITSHGHDCRWKCVKK